MFGQNVKNQRSGRIATRRLKFLLVSDQTGITPGSFQMIMDDVFHVIRRYADFDTKDFDVKVLRGDNSECFITITLKTSISGF